MRYDTKIFLVSNTQTGSAHSLDHSSTPTLVKKMANVSTAQVTRQLAIFGGVSDDNKVVRLNGNYEADQISFDGTKMYSILASYNALGKTDFYIHAGVVNNG